MSSTPLIQDSRSLRGVYFWERIPCI